RLQERDVDAWEHDYIGSSLYQEFVEKRLGLQALPPNVPAAATPIADAPGSPPAVNQSSTSLSMVHDMTPPPRPQNTPWLHQFGVLTQRYCELIWTDRRS